MRRVNLFVTTEFSERGQKATNALMFFFFFLFQQHGGDVFMYPHILRGGNQHEQARELDDDLLTPKNMGVGCSSD